MSAYANEYGYFFNSINSDRTYNAESFEQWLKKFFISGVFQGDMQVTAQSTPDMTVNVAAGYANLDGKPARWDSANTMTLATASGVYNRIDTIVLRRDDTTRTISIEVVTGTAALNPYPTPPTRNADTYELVLAQIFVGVGATSITQANITDTRLDSDICGYVAATVDQIDFDQIQAQYDQWAVETQEFFEDWFENIRGQLDEDAAGHLQNEIDDINTFIGNTALPTTAQTLTGAAAEMYADTANLEDAIAVVVDGNKTSYASGASIGQYVLLKNSTITGCTDGAYKATKAIPYNTAIDSTYLTAVNGGLVNALNGKIFEGCGTGGSSLTITDNTNFTVSKQGWLVVLFTPISGQTIPSAGTLQIGTSVLAMASGSNNVNVDFSVAALVKPNISYKVRAFRCEIKSATLYYN